MIYLFMDESYEKLHASVIFIQENTRTLFLSLLLLSSVDVESLSIPFN